jgi:hypothetical protein
LFKKKIATLTPRESVLHELVRFADLFKDIRDAAEEMQRHASLNELGSWIEEVRKVPLKGVKAFTERLIRTVPAR